MPLQHRGFQHKGLQTGVPGGSLPGQQAVFPLPAFTGTAFQNDAFQVDDRGEWMYLGSPIEYVTGNRHGPSNEPPPYKLRRVIKIGKGRKEIVTGIVAESPKPAYVPDMSFYRVMARNRTDMGSIDANRKQIRLQQTIAEDDDWLLGL